MAPTNRTPLTRIELVKAKPTERPAAVVIDFLPDADEIERRPLPWMARATLYSLVALFGSFIAWASLSEVDMIVIAHGRLVTPLPNIVVQPLETSIIQQLDVRVGQIVKQGERLATLDATFTAADESQLRSRLYSLEAQIARLNAELSGQSHFQPAENNAELQLQVLLFTERQENYRAQQTRLDEKIAQLRAEQETFRQDQRSLSERVQTLSEMEGMQENLLAKQMGARIMLLNARQQRMEVERDFELAKNHERELERALAATQAEKTAFEKSWREQSMQELIAAQRERDNVQDQLQKANKRSQLVTLLAPIDAVVLEMAERSQGSVVTTAEKLFTLVPLNAPLEAEVQIGALDVGYVHLGAKVHLKLSTFPFQRHGVLEGRVRTLSEDAFNRDATREAGPDTYYLSRIDLGAMRLKNLPEHARLLPGMTMTAEIVVGQRSVMSYLLWPLTKTLSESIREP